MISFFMVFICVFVGYFAGYQIAHYEIVKECERLGGFYVHKKVYKCHKVEEIIDEI